MQILDSPMDNNCYQGVGRISVRDFSMQPLIRIWYIAYHGYHAVGLLFGDRSAMHEYTTQQLFILNVHVHRIIADKHSGVACDMLQFQQVYAVYKASSFLNIATVMECNIQLKYFQVSLCPTKLLLYLSSQSFLIINPSNTHFPEFFQLLTLNFCCMFRKIPTDMHIVCKSTGLPP